MDSDKHLHQTWIPSQKGVYEPPPRDIFPNVICRKIKISNHIDRNIHHFIGKDGSRSTSNWKGDYIPIGANKNRNQYRSNDGFTGIYMYSEGVEKSDPAWGTMALTIPEENDGKRSKRPKIH